MHPLQLLCESETLRDDETEARSCLGKDPRWRDHRLIAAKSTSSLARGEPHSNLNAIQGPLLFEILIGFAEADLPSAN